MFQSVKYFLIVGSVALNIAFVGAWLAHAIPAQWESKQAPVPSASTGGVWCPLHRKLNVADEQWRQIEPRLREFRESADSVCKHVSALRLEMVELVAAATTDAEAIAAKQDEILAGQRKMQGLVIGQLLAEKEVLTPEQEAQLFEMIRTQSGCNRAGSMVMPGRAQGGAGRLLRGEPSDQ